ncbi:MAG: hypothetical protein EAZ55_00565 [Cytophagales bacterium]|nr:MAG: hypothetical protein EAZ55_00565 [Cytophagales bacterium]
MKNTKKEDLVSLFFQSLIDFEAHTTRMEFQKIFGMGKGEDLWLRFTKKCDSNTTIFYRILEEDEQQSFNAYIAKYIERFENKS